MAQSAKDYFAQMFKEAGFDETQTAALLGAVSDQRVAGKLDSLVKTATEDYQAQLGRVRAGEQKLKEYADWYGTAGPQYQAAMFELEKAKAELDMYRAGGTGSAPPVDMSKLLTREDYMRDMQKIASDFGTRTAAIIKQTNDISVRHALKFREALDLDAVDKIATEQKLPIEAAYEKYIEPRNKDLEATSRKEWEDNKRKEIEADLRSRFKLPTDPTPTETSPMFARIDKAQLPVSRDALNDELLSAWHGNDKS